MKATVTVTLRPGILDPQGKAVLGALRSMGEEGVSNVRVGKVIELDIDASDEASAEALVKAMCEKILANPVTEDYSIDIKP